MGGFDGILAGISEPLVRYHSCKARTLTLHRKPVKEQSQVGSLTGAVASQKVTEAHKGSLSLIGNQAQSAMA